MTTESISTVSDRGRALGLAGSPNFRDAGGYGTTRGGRVAWGRLFRSGHLARLTPEDEARLAGIELDMVVDLRRADERERLLLLLLLLF